MFSSLSKRSKKGDKNGKGLRHFSMKVCEKVQRKGTTSYNEVADELVSEFTNTNNHLAADSVGRSCTWHWLWWVMQQRTSLGYPCHQYEDSDKLGNSQFLLSLRVCWEIFVVDFLFCKEFFYYLFQHTDEHIFLKYNFGGCILIFFMLSFLQCQHFYLHSVIELKLPIYYYF